VAGIHGGPDLDVRPVQFGWVFGDSSGRFGTDGSIWLD